MTPVIIRARLRHGYVASDPWSPTIDGILAYAVMRDRLGDEAFVTTATRTSELRPVEGLPLEVVRDGDRWWYAASSPRPIGKVAVRQVFFHRRFDDAYERFLPVKQGRVLAAAGPYKASRLADMHTLCRAVEWSAIGDAQAIRWRLGSVWAIGGARGRGYGDVLAWDVGAGDDATAIRARHERPLPVAYAERHGIAGEVMSWSLVPPGRAPASRADCVMPDAPR